MNDGGCRRVEASAEVVDKVWNGRNYEAAADSTARSGSMRRDRAHGQNRAVPPLPRCFPDLHLDVEELSVAGDTVVPGSIPRHRHGRDVGGPRRTGRRGIGGQHLRFRATRSSGDGSELTGSACSSSWGRGRPMGQLGIDPLVRRGRVRAGRNVYGSSSDASPAAAVTRHGVLSGPPFPGGVSNEHRGTPNSKAPAAVVRHMVGGLIERSTDSVAVASCGQLEQARQACASSHDQRAQVRARAQRHHRLPRRWPGLVSIAMNGSGRGSSIIVAEPRGRGRTLLD